MASPRRTLRLSSRLERDAYPEFCERALKKCLPVLQEVRLRCHAETSNSEWECHLPVAWLVHHLPGFRVNEFYALSPLRVIRFRLSRLE